ncbi:heat-inducible transcriptional repressor HrcA [Tengunoibacter tsumagoiensis]|uniref:Heat-inducible transcription repressor HrcA n=1 Tax=Tengunoibacter tsumagoiensis TaxID=2014871 RepID=A0A401ZX22_9CHLR|nr:heat-inducible transcriptional repressor HrcA [Tengunoibacter tsumagoiensis]GCE11360.1 heat-inducible transcription repressor HrcA [Tengunoibacter tsumagoiensis]
MTALSPRKQQILRALVEEYIHNATPVASETLVRKYALPFSSATVRNELAGLEEANLIHQPHTSAGRVPTDLGYRFFVEHLMQESALALDEQRLIRHMFYQVQDQLDQWVRLTASVMARLLNSAALMTPPRSSEGRFKHVEVLAVTDLSAHMVVVLMDGTIQQQRLLLDNPTQQEELSAVTARLNPLFQGKSALEMNDVLISYDPGPVERIVANSLIRLLEQHAEMSGDSFYSEDVFNFLDKTGYQSSFRPIDEDERGERIRKVIEELEHKRVVRVMDDLEQKRILPALATQLAATDGVQVIIGGENQWDEMKDVSLVLARYGQQGKVGGMLGVVGPTRMQYGRAVAVVRYMAQVMNELLADVYGYE